MVNHFLNLAGFVGKEFFQALKDRGVEVKNRRAEANKMFSLPGWSGSICTYRVLNLIM